MVEEDPNACNPHDSIPGRIDVDYQDNVLSLIAANLASANLEKTCGFQHGSNRQAGGFGGGHVGEGGGGGDDNDNDDNG